MRIPSISRVSNLVRADYSIFVKQTKDAGKIRIPAYKAENITNMPMSELFKKGVAVMEAVRKQLYPRKYKAPHRIESKVIPMPNTDGVFFRMGFYHSQDKFEEKARPTLYAKYVKSHPLGDDYSDADWDRERLRALYFSAQKLPKAQREQIYSRPIYYYVGDSFITGPNTSKDVYCIGHQLSGRLVNEISSEGCSILTKRLDNPKIDWDETPFKACLRAFLTKIKEDCPKKSDFKEVHIMDGFYN